MTRAPTIGPVAEHAEVSKSLVLRESPKVSAQKHSEVQAAIEELISARTWWRAT